MPERRNLEWSDGAAGPVLAALASDVSQDWRDYAACAEADPDAWFPGQGQHGYEARRVCSYCFVRAECGEYALAEEIEDGIWGGMGEDQRRRILQRRRREERRRKREAAA